MGLQTGKPRGRPKGSKNKNTAERKAIAKKIAKEIALRIPGAFEGDSHALMMLIYKNPEMPIELRLEAAKAAIRFEKPALQATELTGANGSPLNYTTPIIEVNFVDPEPDSPEGSDAQ